MQTPNTPLPKSRLQLELELPPERLSRAIDQAVGRLSRQTRVAGFRPGKAPRAVLERVLGPSAILDEALEQLVDQAYREAVRDQQIEPLTSPEVEVTQGEEGKPVLFKAVVQVRPEVQLGDFEHFGFKPEVDPVDETMVEKVVDQLRDTQAHLEPVNDRAAQNGDYVIVAFDGTHNGEPFLGGSSKQMPLVLGENRLYPGFEDHIVGLRKGEDREFDLVFAPDFQVEAMRGETAHFALTLKEVRAKVMPEADDEFARSVGKFEDMAELTADLRERLEANALDRARHDFADKIIEYAAANATIDVPEILIDQEVDVVRDEMRSAMARQGISEEAYLSITGKTEAEIREQVRPQAEQRVKSLLVLTEIAKVKAVEVPDSDVQAEVDQARSRYADDRTMVQYFESERGRNYIRSTFRRSRTVEQLVDEWLDSHPEAPRLRHIEETEGTSPVAVPSAAASGSVEAAEPAILTPSEAAAQAGA